MLISPALDMTDADLSEPVASRSPSVARSNLGLSGSVFDQPLAPIATAVAVAILVMLTIRFGRSPDELVVFWLPSAVAAGMWLRGGRGMAFDVSFGALILIGIVGGELLAGYGDIPALVLAVGNMIEIVVAVVLARRFAPGQGMHTIPSTIRLILTTAILAPIPAAAFGAVSLMFIRDLPLATGFQTWWLSHALGLLVVVPLLLSINRRSLVIFRYPMRMLEWAAWIGMLAGLAYAVYFRTSAPLGFLLNPLLIIIAVRLRITGVATALLVISTCILGSILYPMDSMLLPEQDVGARLFTSQLMLTFVCVPFLLLAALLEERSHLGVSARAAQKRAELASEAKSRLLANVAHEIKSPVGGVIGIGEMWSTGQLGPVTATQQEMAGMLVKTARQIETLAHDLLDVARAESGAVKVELRPTDVNGVLEDVRRATMLRPESKTVRIEVACESEGLVAVADSQRLSQVIGNLATNAVKYGAAGGVVHLRARRIDDVIRVEVVDRGPGLSPDKQAQLFEPFNRLGLERSAVEGHGIGLALAKRLIELQGGAIGVDSVVGEGATFWIELPAA